MIDLNDARLQVFGFTPTRWNSLFMLIIGISGRAMFRVASWVSGGTKAPSHYGRELATVEASSYQFSSAMMERRIIFQRDV